MNIVSCATWSPGIEPRMPMVSGWSVALHTSIVAHSNRERSSGAVSVARVTLFVGATARAELGASAGTTPLSESAASAPSAKARAGQESFVGDCGMYLKIPSPGLQLRPERAPSQRTHGV
jgi:hypothetical protein